jgi:hypothetical protein
MTSWSGGLGWDASAEWRHGDGSGDLPSMLPWQPLEAREPEDGDERVGREAPRQEE